MKNELPVMTGFIFPDGTVLDSGSNGHCKTAFRYIRENGLYEEFLSSKFDCEDDFLICFKGALKVCHYTGEHYLYVPRPHGELLENIVGLYKNAGFKIYFYSTADNFNFVTVKIKDYSRLPYNKTIIKTDEGYIYNPRRIGD